MKSKYQIQPSITTLFLQGRVLFVWTKGARLLESQKTRSKSLHKIYIYIVDIVKYF